MAVVTTSTVLPPVPGQSADGRIEVRELTKVFGQTHAVEHLSFTVEPGSVTGFLGPNGAGKTTTLRMILGLVRPTSGSSTVSGLPYSHLADPLRTVGAALEAASFHPARTARNHLRIMTAAAGLPDSRADEVLELVGLGADGKRKVRGYSLGMRQRLGLAGTLLGDPRVLILDEPANGLDPEGIRWLRGFFRFLANEGRTVLVSSHQLNEVQEVADRVIILDRGRLIQSGSIVELTAGSDSVVVRTPNPAGLQAALQQAGLQPLPLDPEQGTAPGLRVPHAIAAQVGSIAFAAGIELHELRGDRLDLEQLFFSLTSGEHAGVNFGDVA
jgi:ABC-2 type transport system ATP-binding protein